MSLAIPVTNGHMAATGIAFGGGVSAGYSPAPEAGGSTAAMQGTGDLMGAHNTPLHVASILLFAGGVIVALHYLGFRFAFDVGLGR